jgi:hypothetical protein
VTATERYRGAGAWLAASALWELARYDIVFAVRGLRGVRSQPPGPAPDGAANEAAPAIAAVLAAVIPFYWKPVRCLQRSIVAARLMRQRAIAAEVVIGYRPVPFFSHAWVEVGGRVVNDSPTFQRRLQVLERLWGSDVASIEKEKQTHVRNAETESSG